VTACLARRLNMALELGCKGEEFSGGLTHDLGRILIAIGAPASFDLVDPMDFREGPAVLLREEEVLGTDHCYFGAWCANLNQLPGSITSAIKFHHPPHEAAEHQTLCGLIATADHMANHPMREQKVDGYDPAANHGWQFFAQLCTEAQRQSFAEQAAAVMA